MGVVLVTEPFGGIVKTILELSEPRLEVLSEHLPRLIRAISDGIENRFDSGALVEVVDGIYGIASVIECYNYEEKLKQKGIEAVLDDMIVNRILVMKKIIAEIMEELDNWEGYTSWEETKIAAKEIFSGARVGMRIGRIIDMFS